MIAEAKWSRSAVQMSQPPEQPPLAAASSFASNPSAATGTPTSHHNTLTTPSPRTISNSLTPSLPAGVPSPLTFTPSLVGSASPAFSDSIFSPHPRASSFTSLPPPSSPPPASHPPHALASSGHRHLSSVLGGVHALLQSYQRLSAVDSTGLQSAVARREESDEDDRQVAAAAQRQRQEVEAGLATLQSIVAELVEREEPKRDSGTANEQRIHQLTGRRDHLLQLVQEGNADVQAFTNKLRGLHRSLGMFAHEHDVELRVTPIVPSTQTAGNSSGKR